jgi:hypothetical protein
VRPLSPTGRVGATLIELLAALGIGVMVMAVLLLAHHALTGQASSINNRAGRELLRQNTTALLQENLQSLFHVAKDDALGITLENSTTNLVMLSFVRWTPAGTSRGLNTSRLERVTFTYAPIDGEDQLVYITETLTGPGSSAPPRTNWPGRVWPSLQVHLHDGTLWQTNWTPAAPATPTAAKLIMTGDGERIDTTEALFLIPAGLSITSRLDRAD